MRLRPGASDPAAKGLTLTELGVLTGYSAAQVSRYERGISPMTDVDVLRRFADALELPHRAFGLVPPAPRPEVRHGQPIGATTAFPRMPFHKVGNPGWEDGEDAVRRRKLIAGLAATAAAAAGSPLTGSAAAQADEAPLGELLIARLRDAMLGLGTAPVLPPAGTLDTDFTRALADFDACRYAGLAVRLPRLIRSGHALTTSDDRVEHFGLLAKSYLLATRMLIKMDEQQLLIQSAAYTVARRGDRDGMRELTDEAAAVAKELGGTVLLRDHGGGFSPLTVQLHRISAENYAGDPLAALTAARTISLKALPSVERRSRALGDIAITYDRLGRRSECVRTLLAAEHCAPEETHARPATKSLISSLLISGPTSTELRGLAARSGILL
ncbi:helix-turn-helix domain-containing protein [Streptomyces sp. NPDC058200]|uniref:helix-turn-helix domain-containing protein n=1 Tax=Streptomyces sp. NPDC058200 TaxID=3346378 RepID=UPI0036EF45A0